jgi:hypothetical protein
MIEDRMISEDASKRCFILLRFVYDSSKKERRYCCEFSVPADQLDVQIEK